MACSYLPSLSDHHIEKLTRAVSVPRAVASEALSIGLLIGPRSLPLAVLIRRRGARLTFQCDEEKVLLMQSSYLPAKFLSIWPRVQLARNLMGYEIRSGRVSRALTKFLNVSHKSKHATSGRWYSTARVSKRLTYETAACLLARYCTNLTCSDLI